MNKEVKIVQDRKQFNAFVEHHPQGNVHQIYEWGEFQAQSGQRDKFWPLIMEDNGKIVASAMIVRQKLPMGKTWLYCARGPLVDYAKEEHVRTLFGFITELAQKENAIFFRFESKLSKTQENPFVHIQSRPAHAHYQPESTLIVDLQPSEEDILAQMKQKGRYNIKIAKKHGVTVEESKDIKTFYNIFKETTSRDHFSGHPLSYYENMMKTLGPDRAKLFLASYQGIPIAGAIVTYFNQTATYYFGASSNEHRNVMAPYLLHWHIMRDAKARGSTQYDLFGIAPENSKNHPWEGVTSFKLKFGGTRVNYAPAQEVVYQPLWFWLMKLIKRLRG